MTPSKMLAPLEVGDRIPYRMQSVPDAIFGHAYKPTWLTVTAVFGPGRYEVEYPDGHRETLRDSE